MKSNKVYIITAIVCAVAAIAAVAVLLLVLKDRPADDTVLPTPTAEVTEPARTEKPAPPVSGANANHTPTPGNASSAGFEPAEMTEQELEDYLQEIREHFSTANIGTESSDAESYPIGERGTAWFVKGELVLTTEDEISLPSLEGCPLYQPWWDNCSGVYYYDGTEGGLGLYFVVFNDRDVTDNRLVLYFHEGKLIHFACHGYYTYDRFDADAAEMIYNHALQLCTDGLAAKAHTEG